MIEADEIVRLLLEADEDDQEDIDLAKDVTDDPSPQRDFLVKQEGSIWIIDPQNREASRWLHSVISDDSTWIGSALAVEHRYFGDVLYAIQDMGFTSNVKLVNRKANEGLCEAEDDDEEDIKDILGPEFYDPNPPTKAIPGSIERFDRWANVTIGDKNFCISYITPVAVYIPGQGILFTERDWSSSTSRHIGNWAEEIGMTNAGGRRYKYAELKKRFKRIPQSEISRMFKEEAAKVDWSKKDMRAATKVRSGKVGFKYVEPEHKVDLKPWVEPEEF